LIKPARKSIKSLLTRVREIVRKHLGDTAHHLITRLNPVIRGWANYHRHVVSKLFLPASLRGSHDGDRQMVKILAAVLTDGLAAVEAACAEALAGSVHSADVILNILARRRDPAPAVMILAPEALRLRQAPLSDCARYDRLRRAG
jgi:hypothetical protein